MNHGLDLGKCLGGLDAVIAYPFEAFGQSPLPLLARQAIRHAVKVHPLLGPLSPSTTGGDDVQMGIVLAIAAMGVDGHNVTALQGAATDPAIDLIESAGPRAHGWTQHRL